jgi:alcohol-forming fatty acyl-CoA reductase
MSVSSRKARSARNGAKASVAFYDLDGTLIDLNLVHATLYMLANLGEWTGRITYTLGFLARLPMLYLAEQRDRYLLNVVLFEIFRGVSRDRLVMLGQEYCDRILARRIFPQAVELIEANRAAGLVPVLVTGSPDFIVAPLAERLGVKAFAANRLVFSRGRATGRLREPVMAGDEKASWCAEYVAAAGLDLGACWGYADSHYDLPFLAAVGHPVAVNPNRKLLVTAHARHWPVLRFAKAQKEKAGMLDLPQFLEERLEGAIDGAARS